MKKIIFITGVILIIPVFISIIYYEVTNNKDDNPIIIRVKRVEKDTIISIDIEEYLVGVVAGEMPVSFEIEALKAQTVASRTYAIRRIKENNEYDVVDTVSNQVYLDDEHLKKSWKLKYSENIKKIKKAVESTKGETLKYDNKYIEALFFSTSNGYTESSQNVFNFKASYLTSVESNWDKISPVFNDQEIFEKSVFCQKMKLSSCKSIIIEKENRTESNRVDTITINNKEYSGKEIRSLLGLRSSDFEIIVEENQVVVKTSGYGHGVGMSQYGANGMAKEGYSYKEILEHYYQGAKISKI